MYGLAKYLYPFLLLLTLWRSFRALSGQPKHRDHFQDNLYVDTYFRRKVLVQLPRNKRDIAASHTNADLCVGAAGA